MSRNLGGRPKKVEIGLNEESLRAMMKTVWNEAEETKSKATAQYNKQIRNISDNSDIALVGKTNADYLKIINDCTEKRISIIKIAKEYIQKDSKNDSGNENVVSVVSEEQKAQLIDIMKANLSNNQEEERELKSVEEIQERENREIGDIVNGSDDIDITNVNF